MGKSCMILTRYSVDDVLEEISFRKKDNINTLPVLFLFEGWST